MFYEMLTDERPFRGKSVAAILHQHVHEPAPPMSAKFAHHEPLISALLAKKQE